jgi:hypothetical protein
MRNYEVFLNSDFSWCVVETATEQIIKTFFFEEDAVKYNRFLNKGAAFDGWTPAFMLINVTSVMDINDVFSATFT